MNSSMAMRDHHRQHKVGSIIYTAIAVKPALVRDAKHSGSSKSSLAVPASDNAKSDYARASCCSNFVVGCMIGMLLSSVGFHLLLRYLSKGTGNVGVLQPLQILLFSALWSSSTYIVAYTLFSMLHYGCNRVSSSRQKIAERLECCFAIGVFCGFCVACAATDVQYGLPAHNIVWTLLVAAVWVLVMVTCSCCEIFSHEDRQMRDDEESEIDEWEAEEGPYYCVYDVDETKRAARAPFIV